MTGKWLRISRIITDHTVVIPIKKQKVSTLILIDLLCICLGFGLFCLFHFVLDLSGDPQPVVLISPAPAEPPAASAAVPSGEPPAESAGPEDGTSQAGHKDAQTESGLFGEKFSDRFTGGEVLCSEGSYRSRNISVTVSHREENGIVFNIADIYIRDMRFFKTALGGDGFRKSTEMLPDLARRHGAVVAISGDHYGARAKGVVVRNGILYRNTPSEDVCILTSGGNLITIPADEYDPELLGEYDIWQVWCFGPELLENGRVKTSFNSNVKRANPRSAIGCVEPGHYYFVQVDGRIPASAGMTLEQLSRLFQELGCVSAYNLDGGQTSGFWWNGSLLSYPYGRPVWDMIYIGEDE